MDFFIKLKNYFLKVKCFYHDFGLVQAVRKIITDIHRRTYRTSPRLSSLAKNIGCRCIGPEKTFQIFYGIFRFRCRYNLFLGLFKSFWLGKCLSDHVLKVQYVDPGDIKYSLQGGFVPYIQSGDWDLQKRPFEMHHFIIEHYKNNIPLESTAQYKDMKIAIAQMNWKKSYWCRCDEDLKEYFRILLNACEDIKNGKYLSQHELPKDISSTNGYYPNEVLVSIDRNGDFLHENGGWHRLSMAKLCQLRKIPVVVIRKHIDVVDLKKEGNVV